MTRAAPQDASAHSGRYEELRRQVVEQRSFGGRLGLAVLLRQGLATWVEQWSQIPMPTPSADIPMPSPLPDDASADVIHVLAAMALSHVQEVHA